MKKQLLVGLSIAIMLMAAGCGSDTQPQNTPPSGEDDVSFVDPVPAPDTPDDGMADGDEADDDWNIDLDENAPEHITLDSISDTVPVPLYCTLTVDQKDLDFKCGEVRFPSQLYVEETMELHPGGKSDSNDDDLMVGEYFQDDQKRYIYAEADGTLPATRPATKHILSAGTIYDNEPYTVESLAGKYEGCTVTEITVDGAAGFAVRPDTEKNDSGFASVLFCINAGSYDYGYGTAYLCMEVNYQGGLADYSEVDFDEITAALLELTTVEFQPAQ